MPSESTLTLFIPDLFGFQSTLSKLTQEELSQLPATKFPVLEKWLSRGLREKSAHHDNIIFSEFGLSIEDNKDKPFAALSLLAENNPGLKKSSKYWLRADPVCLQADRDAVILTAHEELALTQDEADKLVDKINSHFVDEPWSLHSLAPHRWYLALEKSADLITHPIAKVIGENVNHFMSKGDDAHYWLTITNEIQMLLHGTNVNFERESRNMVTANSLWLWGGGSLPKKNELNSKYDKIITNDNLFSGLGYYCDLDVLPLNSEFIGHVELGNNFIVLDTLSGYVQNRDVYSFMQALNKMEEGFLKDCNRLLLNGKIEKIKLISDNGLMIVVTKKILRRWWKRIKPFTDFKYA